MFKHKVKIFFILLISLVIARCVVRNTPVIVIPKEGDIVTWKITPALITKTILGQRREHIPSQFDYEFYHPQLERFVGQFPIDYVPQKFEKISVAEAEKLSFKYSQNQLEFNLMLNGAISKATDNSFKNEDDNQIKVYVNSLTIDMLERKMTTKNTFKGMVAAKNNQYLIPETLFHQYGLDCYNQDPEGKLVICLGKSKNPNVTGVQVSIVNDTWGLSQDKPEGVLMGENIEPVLGGVSIRWVTHQKNLPRWQEIDAAIWRLLNAWNVSTVVKNDY